MDGLFQKKNVVGYGFGEKITGGINTGIPCLTVMVSKKLLPLMLTKQDLVPKEIDGRPTDVIETGEIRALQSRTERWRPAPGGVSIGHYQITAGTLGSVVIDNETESRVILSNNHVLANSNDATIGDPIYQPGPYDGGGSNDQIATLLRYIPIEFGEGGSTCPIVNFIVMVLNGIARVLGSSHRLYGRRQSSGENYVDAAIAMPLSQDLVSDQVFEIGEILGHTDTWIGMGVKKSGRTTGLTFGQVTIIGASVKVSYGSGKTATFVDQIVLGKGMSEGGDSGSLVVSLDDKAIGLLFAGSDTTTIVSPIGYVLEALGVRI